MIPVVPLPVSVSTSDGVLRLIDGCSVGAQDHALDGLVEQFVEDVAADTGLRLTVVGLGGDIRLALSPAGSPTTDTVIGVNPRGGEPADERHQLQVTPTGATVEATTVEGVFRGLTTLRQLISAGREGDEALVSAMEVRDGPRYAWRGLSLDVARTFHGPEQVRRVIDIMALHKFNVLHLHLTDDQGWRLEVPGWPALTTIGAAGALGDRPGGFYSQQEFTDLVRYAADRWITVVPEVDMPGHCGAAIRAYPELGASPNVLDPDSPSVQAFLADVVATMAELAPGPWLHIGGDEAFGMAP
ncbi:MAG TPA: family 20 glycosylhydrolase, partial [Ilumatobacteraceae bacterium]|nr:family 20 glycosylhydrolase [Ilumatobacteraceae bacterium]